MTFVAAICCLSASLSLSVPPSGGPLDRLKPTHQTSPTPQLDSRGVSILQLGPAEAHADDCLPQSLALDIPGHFKEAIAAARKSNPRLIILEVNWNGGRDYVRTEAIARELSELQRDFRVIALIHLAHAEAVPAIWPVKEWYFLPDGHISNFICVWRSEGAPPFDFRAEAAAINRIAHSNPLRSADFVNNWSFVFSRWRIESDRFRIDGTRLNSPVAHGPDEYGDFTGLSANHLVRIGFASAVVESRTALLKDLGFAPDTPIDLTATEFQKGAETDARKLMRSMNDSSDKLYNQLLGMTSARSEIELRTSRDAVLAVLEEMKARCPDAWVSWISTPQLFNALQQPKDAFSSHATLRAAVEALYSRTASKLSAANAVPAPATRTR